VELGPNPYLFDLCYGEFAGYGVYDSGNFLWDYDFPLISNYDRWFPDMWNDSLVSDWGYTDANRSPLWFDLGEDLFFLSRWTSFTSNPIEDEEASVYSTPAEYYGVYASNSLYAKILYLGLASWRQIYICAQNFSRPVIGGVFVAVCVSESGLVHLVKYQISSIEEVQFYEDTYSRQGFAVQGDVLSDRIDYIPPVPLGNESDGSMTWAQVVFTVDKASADIAPWDRSTLGPIGALIVKPIVVSPTETLIMMTTEYPVVTDVPLSIPSYHDLRTASSSTTITGTLGYVRDRGALYRCVYNETANDFDITFLGTAFESSDVLTSRTAHIEISPGSPQNPTSDPTLTFGVHNQTYSFDAYYAGVVQSVPLCVIFATSSSYPYGMRPMSYLWVDNVLISDTTYEYSIEYGNKLFRFDQSCFKYIDQVDLFQTYDEPNVAFFNDALLWTQQEATYVYEEDPHFGVYYYHPMTNSITKIDDILYGTDWHSYAPNWLQSYGPYIGFGGFSYGTYPYDFKTTSQPSKDGWLFAINRIYVPMENKVDAL
jgi:hypothetical protein